MRYTRSLGALALFTLSAPALADSCDGFVDVDSGATYCTAVTYVQQRGITIGCTDNTHYCPNNYVTRAQMALFLQRAGQGDSTNSLLTPHATIGGGLDNVAGNNDEYPDVVGGGGGNAAIGQVSVVAGGYSNQATGEGSSVVGGVLNLASGEEATVVGGFRNNATGDTSIAAGEYAGADQTTCAVFSLWGGGPPGMSCLGIQSIFRVAAYHGFSVDYQSRRADGGGVRYVAISDLFGGQTIATWTGAYLSDAGVWTNVSDRAVKDDFTPIDDAKILDRVVHMPVERWRYKAEPNATHIGPVAQDFYAAFNVGSDDKHITPIDEGGVALAAIQGLNTKLSQELQERDAQIAELKARLDRLEAH